MNSIQYAGHLEPLIEFTRVYLAIFYTFVAVFYTVRVFNKNRLTSAGVIFAGNRFCSSWWNHLLFKMFRAIIWLVCVIRVFVPATDNYLGMLLSFNFWPTLVLGNIFLTIGFLLTMVVHINLASNWRSGIDPLGPQQLKTSGLYSYSRNPMYIGVAMAQLGFFLALPSLFTLLCLMLGFYTLRSQISIEERHLQTRFKCGYLRYKAAVPRWL